MTLAADLLADTELRAPSSSCPKSLDHLTAQTPSLFSPNFFCIHAVDLEYTSQFNQRNRSSICCTHKLAPSIQSIVTGKFRMAPAPTSSFQRLLPHTLHIFHDRKLLFSAAVFLAKCTIHAIHEALSRLDDTPPSPTEIADCLQRIQILVRIAKC